MKYTLFIISLFLFGCFSSQESDGNKFNLEKSISQDSEYRKSIEELIPKDIQKELPKELYTNNFELFFELEPKADEELSNLTNIYISYSLKSTDSLKDKLEKRAIANYNFHDDCNLVLYRYQKGTINTGIKGREWLYNEWVDNLDTCSDKRLPIPNFVNAGKGKYEYKYGISKDYKLYVTKVKSGIHFDEKYYADKIIMPKGWERGYSQGYAINEKEKKVIYWFVIW